MEMYRLEILNSETLDVLEVFYSSQGYQHFIKILDDIYKSKGFISYIPDENIRRKGHNSYYNGFYNVKDQYCRVKINIFELITPLY